MSRRPHSRFGLTTRGSALLTAGITAAICGVALGQRDLVRVAVLLIAVPLVASVIVSRSRLSVSCRRVITPSRASAGEPVTVALTLANQSLLPTGSLMLEDTLPEPLPQRARFTLDSLRGREMRSLAYRLPLAGRGHYEVGPLRMRLADPFGLVERTRSFRAVNTVVVLPVVDPLAQSSLPGVWDSAHKANSHSVGSLGSDDASIREYRHGDDLRRVHWRSTARLGSMMVRQEQRPWHARTVLLLDTRSAGHRRDLEAGPQAGDPRAVDSFEWAVSAIASIAALLRSKGREVGIVAGPIRAGVIDPHRLLDELADLPATDDPDLRNPIDLLDSIAVDSTVIAVLGDLDEDSLRLLAAQRRAAGTAVALLLDTTTWAPSAESVRRRAIERHELARLMLVAAGWRVVTVAAGSTIEQAWINLINAPTVDLPSAGRAWEQPMRMGAS